MRDAQDLYKPDWIMLGAPLPVPEPGKRVMVIASQTLHEAQVAAALEHVISGHPWEPLGSRYNIFAKAFEMTAIMRDIQMAVGDTYGEAMQTILQRWSPDASARSNAEGLGHARPAAIGSGPAELMP
jgi:hypothetical protein